MKHIERISIIGAGNLAWHLAPVLEGAGMVIEEVFSRDQAKAKKLAKRLYHAQPQSHLNFEDSKATLFLIAVTDQAIGEVAQKITLPPNTILAHTSGSQPLRLLNPQHHAVQTGVFYPMQTFSIARKPDFRNIPVFIESEDKRTLDALAEVAYQLTEKVYDLSSEERVDLHLAAVFACNFSNELLALAKGFTDKTGLDFGLLKPLVEEMVDKAFAIGPENSQTGPAVREDLATIDLHLSHLKGDALSHSIYKTITESIIARKNLKAKK